MQVGGHISLSGGPLASGQSLDIPGNNWEADLKADFSNAGLITMEGAGGYSLLYLAGFTFTNSGTIRTFSGGTDGRRFINNGTLNNTGVLDLQGGAIDTSFGAITLSNQNDVRIGAGQVLQLDAPFTQTAAGTLHVDHDSTPVIGSVSSSSTATIAGCVGGTGPMLTPHTTLAAMTASGGVTGTFSCTDFVTQQFNASYTATQVNLTTPNTDVAVAPSSGSHPAGTPIMATVTRVGNSGFPIGTVDLFEGSTLIDSNTLGAMGEAALSTSSLALGPHTLHVAYEGNMGDDPTDSGRFTITLVTPPPQPTCGANGKLMIGPGVTSTPSVKPGSLVFKGPLTACSAFDSFTGAKFPISAGSFTMSIKGLNPGATCSLLDTGPGAKFKAKLKFKFTGINPKNGKPAAAAKATTVGIATFSEQTSPFGHTGMTLTVTSTKSLFVGHTATVTIVYDETPAQISASCAAKGGLKKLHFGAILDKKVQWNPVNGTSTFVLN
jgi:hypothetical protein